MTGDQTFEMVKLAIQILIAAGSVAAAFLAWRTKKAVQDVHVSLDGRLTQLLERTGEASRAEGRDSMRTGDGRDVGGIGATGPAGAAGAQGPIGVQGPAGAQGTIGPPGESAP